MSELKTLFQIGICELDKIKIRYEAIKWVKEEGMIITADEWNEFFNISDEDLKNE